MKSKYTVKIYAPQELNHASYVQTGLFELENEGFLSTKVMMSFKKRLGTISLKNAFLETNKAPHPKTSFYELTDLATNKTIHFATDLYDAADSFSEYALAHCDYVFKRNYESKYISQLPKKCQQKLHPLGWSFGVHSSFKKNDLKLFCSLMATNALLNLKPDRHFFTRILKTYRQQKKHWNFINTTRTLERFEEKPMPPANDFIVFQTRCFAHENTPELKQLHQQRYQIILLLRKQFPQLFKGGFIPSALVNQHYTDAVTNLQTDPQSYLQLVKSAKIGIYTQGIQDSPAWKMAEYLSQGKVIIAQKFNTKLSVALEHKKHLLFFNHIDEIPELCNLVLQDRALAEKLAHTGRMYYENHIAPKQNIKRLIELMLGEQNK
jgi:hypothetical protein